MPRGGKRPGSGRPRLFTEPTTPIRVPLSLKWFEIFIREPKNMKRIQRLRPLEAQNSGEVEG